MQSKHHPFSPSVLERRSLCPGSWTVEKDLPDMTSAEAQSGTKLHAAIAVMIENNSLTAQDKIVDNDDESVLCLKMLEMYYTERNAYGVKHKTYTELPLEFYEEGNSEEPLYSGTADVVIVGDDALTVIDWKTGFAPVIEASDNFQGAAYALAAMQQFQKNKAVVVFYNPRIKQYSRHEFTNWMNLYHEIKNVIDKCKTEQTLKPCENACRYCKGALSGSCPALQSQTLGLSVSAKAGLIEQLKDLSDEKALELFEACKPAQKLIDAIEAEIKERAEKNGQCGDYTIKLVSGGYECKDIQQTFRVSGLAPDKFLDCCSVSLPKLKKQYADTAEGMTKKEAEALLMDKIAPYLQAKPERKTLTKKKA